jgi:hypothetical protein
VATTEVPNGTVTGGGGGGAASAVGPYTDRATLVPSPTLGSTYPSTDGPYTSTYDGSAWVDTLPGWGSVTAPPSTGWTWISQGTSVVSTVGGMREYLIQHGATVRGQYRTPPAAPYTIDIRSIFTTEQTDATVRINFENISGVKQLSLALTDDQILVQRLSGAYGFVANAYIEASLGTPRESSWRLRNDGTNLYIYQLTSVGNPRLIYTETIAAYLTTVDGISVVYAPQAPGSAGATTASPLVILDWTEG